MVNIIASVLEVLLALFLVGLNGFFVASEFAFVRIHESSVDKLKEKGKFGSETLKEVMNELDDYLAVTQLGITVSSLGLGWVGEPAVAALIEELFGGLITGSVLHIISFAIGFSIITYLHVVIGELAPKTLSIQRTERICLIVALPMKFFKFIFKPGIIVFNGSANKITKTMGIDPASEVEEVYDENELRRLLKQSSKQGTVDKSEVDMIKSVFELDDINVKQVMIPRPDVDFIKKDDTIEDIKQKVAEKSRTRYPVIDNNKEIQGYIDVKDIIKNEDADLDDIIEDITLLSETASIRKTIDGFKKNDTQMIGVVDEWGVLEGIVTVEDAIEVLVGDIKDKYDVDSDTPDVEEIEDDLYVSDGSVSITRLNKIIGSNFERSDTDTIAGVILEEKEKIPEEGYKIKIDNYEISVKNMKGNRIKSVEIRKVDN